MEGKEYRIASRAREGSLIHEERRPKAVPTDEYNNKLDKSGNIRYKGAQLILGDVTSDAGIKIRTSGSRRRALRAVITLALIRRGTTHEASRGCLA